ncbi:MAG: oxidoreductase [Pirellulaceae bacterium]|nr:MAG: oxidoreductase [Pirellulaceae bacterium]
MVVALPLLAALLGGAHPAQAQNIFGAPTVDRDDAIFLTAPRPLVRLLSEGEQALREGRFSEAIEALGTLLDETNEDLPPDLRGQDFFLQPHRRGYYNQSIKGRARQLLGELPPPGREVLELQFGVTAKQVLAQAIEKRSVVDLEAVVRQFPHTSAAYEAMILLAEERLQRGHPLAAAVLLTRLWETPTARQRWGADLGLATSQCWVLANDLSRAAAIVEQTREAFPGARWTIAGRRIELSAEVDRATIVDALRRLTEPVLDDRSVDDWLVQGGNARRNAVVDTSMPLPNVRWEKVLHGSLPEQERLMQIAERETQADRVLLTRLEPRVVGKTVLAKTTDGEVMAVDLETGLTQWAFYQYAAPVKLGGITPSAGYGLEADPAETLAERVWSDSAFGRFSADGERLYYITTETAAEAGMPTGLAMHNRLQAISISEEGKILWQVGGPPDEEGEDPLAGIYFLGPPLPYGGQLFVIGESNGETRLVVLRARDGRLAWSQQLVHPLYRQLRFDNSRRSQSLSPTIADGVVICPTGAGAIVAVDLPTRRLLWGLAYDADATATNPLQFPRGAFGGYDTRDHHPLVPTWIDVGAIAADGLVAFSPPESNVFFVVDALTGEMVLPPQRREDGRYLAGIQDGALIVVGDQRAFAVDLSTQTLAWEVAYPERARLAGRGVSLPDGILVPLRGGLLIKIDGKRGRVVDQVVVDRELGNLVVHRGSLLSLAGARLAAFYTRDHLAEEVAQRLAANPQDTWGLNQKAQLALADGRIDEAFALLRQSMAIDAEDIDTRFLLIETLMQGLKKDFDVYRQAAAQYRGLAIDGPQRSEFLQWLAVGNIRAGQHWDAFLHLMELVDHRTMAMPGSIRRRTAEMEIEADYSVDTDRWLATQLAQAYQAASPAQRRAMDAIVDEALGRGQRLMGPLRQQLLQYFNWHPYAQTQIIAMAEGLWPPTAGDAMAAYGDPVGAERLLVPLVAGGNSPIRERAQRLLGRPTFWDQTLLGVRGRTGQRNRGIDDGAATTPTTGDSSAGDAKSLTWPSGRVVQLSIVQDRPSFSPGISVPVVHQRYGRPEFQLRIAGDVLVVINQNGEDVAHIPIDRASADNNDVFTRAWVRGGLLLLETSSEILGINLYHGFQTGQEALLWRQSLVHPAAGPRTPFGMPNPTPVNTSFGVQIYRRESNGRRIEVGPLTPHALMLYTAGTLMGLDPYTGKQLWRRSGFDDRIRVSHRGDELAVVDPSMARVLVLDARDGTKLREFKHAGFWEHWFSAGPWMIDYREQQAAAASGPSIQSTATLRPTLRLWNPFDTNAEPKIIALQRGARAATLEERFLVVLEPTGTLHYWDLVTGVYQAHHTEVDADLNDIALQRFGDRLLVLSRATYDNPPPRVLNMDSISRDFHPVNGWIHAMHIADGRLLWARARRAVLDVFPERASPQFAVHVGISDREFYIQCSLLDSRSCRSSYRRTGLYVAKGSHSRAEPTVVWR